MMKQHYGKAGQKVHKYHPKAKVFFFTAYRFQVNGASVGTEAIQEAALLLPHSHCSQWRRKHWGAVSRQHCEDPRSPQKVL